MSLSQYETYEQSEENVVTNKPLAIGDSFFQTLKETNLEAYDLFINILLRKAFKLDQGAKIDKFARGISEEAVLILEEVVGYFLLLQQQKLSDEDKKTLHDDTHAIGRFFAYQFLESNALLNEKNVELYIGLVLSELNKRLVKRLDDYKRTRQAYGRQVRDDLAVCLHLQEDFFTMREYIGKKLLLPPQISYYTYFNAGILKGKDYFSAMHQLLAKEQDGFDFFTMLTRNSMDLYPEIRELTEKIAVMKGGKKTISTYLVNPKRDSKKEEYGYGIVKLGDVKQQSINAFCIENLYKNVVPDISTLSDEQYIKTINDTPLKHVGTDRQSLLLSDIFFMARGAQDALVDEVQEGNGKTTKHGKSYNAETFKKIIDTAPHDMRDMLSFYLEKAQTSGSLTSQGMRIYLGGSASTAAFITTNEQERGEDRSVTIKLYKKFGEKIVALPFCRGSYGVHHGLFGSVASEGIITGKIRSLIERRMEESKEFEIFTPLQRKLYSDMCIDGITAIAFSDGKRTKNDILNSVINNIDFGDIADTPFRDDNFPRVELPEAEPLTAEADPKEMQEEERERLTEARYANFTNDALAQRLAQGEATDKSLEDFSPAKVDYVAMRFDKEYRENVYERLSTKELLQEYEFLHHKKLDIKYCIYHIIFNRLTSYSTDRGAYIRQLIENHRRVLHEMTRDRIYGEKTRSYLNNLLELIPEVPFKKLTGKKSKTKESQNRRRELVQEMLTKEPDKEHAADRLIAIYENRFDEYKDALQGDLLVFAHLKSLTVEPQKALEDGGDTTGPQGLEILGKLLSSEGSALGRYMESLRKDDKLTAYMNTVKRHLFSRSPEGAKKLYISLVKVWYDHVGKSAIHTLLAPMKSRLDSKRLDDDTDLVNPTTKTIQKYVIENNYSYRFLKQFVMESISQDDLAAIPELQASIKELRNAYPAYHHYLKIQELRKARKKGD